MDAEDVVERLNDVLELPSGMRLVLTPTTTDAAWLEWQTYLQRKICAIFRVDVSDLPPTTRTAR